MLQTPNLINLLSPNNIVIYMLVFTRITGLLQSAPFFSTVKSPTMTKLWFAALIAFILYPLVHASKAYITPRNITEFIILIIFEFLIGYLIGFIANFILEGIRMTGNILSIQTGLSISEALDPATGVSSNEISRIYIYLATLIFLATGAYQFLFITLYGSFNTIPIGTFLFFDEEIIKSVLVLFGQLFKIGFGVALPIFAVLLILDILLGMMNKVMPQMNIFMVSIPLKIYLGLLLSIMFTRPIAEYLNTLIPRFMHQISVMF